MSFLITPNKKKWIYILSQFANKCDDISIVDWYLLKELTTQGNYTPIRARLLNKSRDIFLKYQNDNSSVRMSSTFSVDIVERNYNKYILSKK